LWLNSGDYRAATAIADSSRILVHPGDRPGKPQEFAGIAKEKPVVPAPYALDWYHLTELCKAIHTARPLVH